jgi:glutathione S-transferase
MMKQVLGRYSEAELDALLAHHPRPDRIRFLKKMFKAPYDADAVEKSRRRLARALGRMDAALSDGPWLAGESYSLADIAAAPVVDRIERLGMADLWDDLAGVSGWVGRLKARPAYGEALPPDAHRLPVAVPG